MQATPVADRGSERLVEVNDGDVRSGKGTELGTRREELLLQPWELEKINLIRRGLAGHKPEEAIQRLLMFVKKFPTNTEMLKGIPG